MYINTKQLINQQEMSCIEHNKTSAMSLQMVHDDFRALTRQHVSCRWALVAV